MTILIATRGPKHGQCNICGAIGALTEDHTPPKGCLKPTQVELRHLVHLLAEDQPANTKGRFSQNGVKYRTLCHRCNNTLLGTKYDPPFIDFVNGIGLHLKSSLDLPPTLLLRGQPQAILRSLLGHISPQGVARYLKGPLTEKLRDYFVDSSLPFPAELRAYYWAYPFRPHIMFRDAAYLDIPTGTTFAIWLLKFFPVAFLIAWDEPKGLSYPIHSFDAWRSLPYNSQVDMPLQLAPVPPMFWPEAPTDRSVIAYGQEAMYVKS
jgi:hypothetical protein